MASDVLLMGAVAYDPKVVTIWNGFRAWFDRAVPEDAPYWEHTLEGSDDMPAHLKSSLLGPSVTVPVSRGRLALGTWQGIYLCEHRDSGGARELVVTVWGEESGGG